jgi:hypothetical protein
VPALLGREGLLPCRTSPYRILSRACWIHFCRPWRRISGTKRSMIILKNKYKFLYWWGSDSPDLVQNLEATSWQWLRTACSVIPGLEAPSPFPTWSYLIQWYFKHIANLLKMSWLLSRPAILATVLRAGWPRITSVILGRV